MEAFSGANFGKPQHPSAPLPPRRESGAAGKSLYPGGCGTPPCTGGRSWDPHYTEPRHRSDRWSPQKDGTDRISARHSPRQSPERCGNAERLHPKALNAGPWGAHIGPLRPDAHTQYQCCTAPAQQPQQPEGPQAMPKAVLLQIDELRCGGHATHLAAKGHRRENGQIPHTFDTDILYSVFCKNSSIINQNTFFCRFLQFLC